MSAQLANLEAPVSRILLDMGLTSSDAAHGPSTAVATEAFHPPIPLSTSATEEASTFESTPRHGNLSVRPSAQVIDKACLTEKNSTLERQQRPLPSLLTMLSGVRKENVKLDVKDLDIVGTLQQVRAEVDHARGTRHAKGSFNPYTGAGFCSVM